MMRMTLTVDSRDERFLGSLLTFFAVLFLGAISQQTQGQGKLMNRFYLRWVQQIGGWSALKRYATVSQTMEKKFRTL